MKWILRLWLASLLLALASCGGGDDHALRVGLDPDYPPFEGKGKDGRLKGVSVELAQAIGRELGRPVEFHEIGFDGLIPALRAGQLDLVVSSLTRTEERAQIIDFSDPYARVDLLVLVPIGGAVTFRDVMANEGTVVVVGGTTGQLWASRNLPQSRVRVVEQADAAAAEVATGRSAAWIYDEISVLRYQERFADQTRALTTAVRGDEWAIGIRKGDTELKTQVNEALKTLREQHKFQDWQGEFLREDLERARRLELSFDVFAVGEDSEAENSADE